MDYGVSTALKGFFGSGDAKAQRNNDLAILQKMHAQDQSEKNQRAQLDQQMLTFQGTLDEFSNDIIKGKGIRESDLDAYKLLNRDAQDILKTQISKAGGITKFLQGGGSKQLQDYKNAITQSDIANRLTKNADAFKKGYEASLNSDGKQTAHLIPNMFMDNLSAYHAGETDHIVWNGLLNEYDMEDIDAPVDQLIDANMVFEHNPMNMQYAAENMEKDYGITRGHFDSDQAYHDQLLTYYNLKNKPKYGTEAIEVTVSSIMNEIISSTNDALPQEVTGEKDMYGNDITVSVYQADPNVARFKENFVASDAAIKMDDLFGYSQSYNTFTKNGRNVRNVGKVFATPYIEDLVATAIWGDDYVNGMVKNQKSIDDYFVGGSGDKIGAGQSYAGETMFTTEGTELADGDDVQLLGFTIATKVSGMVDGEYIETLITDSQDGDYSEDLSKYDGYKVTQVYVAELLDTDFLDAISFVPGMDFNDVYYKEIDIRSIMPELDKKLDINDELSDQRTQSVKYKRRKSYEESQNTKIENSHKHALKVFQVGDPYDENGESNLNKIYNHYVPKMDASLTQHFGANRNKNLDAHLFTFMFDQAITNNPSEYYFELDENIDVLNDMVDTELLQIVESGNVGNFYQWLDNNNYNSKKIKKDSKHIQRALFDNDFYTNPDGSKNYKRRRKLSKTKVKI